MIRFFFGLLTLLWLGICCADPVAVRGLRIWPAPDHTRLVLDITGAVEHRVFTLTEPERVVVDLLNTRRLGDLAQPNSAESLVLKVRTGSLEQSNQRIVLDLRNAVRPKSFLLYPSGDHGHRLVIDLFPTEAGSKPIGVQREVPPPDDIVVAIDAGHGGEDPGAIGPSGEQEKKITLAVAKMLAEKINHERGMRAILVRAGDYYVGLRKRMSIARAAKADLFISIHADAFHDPKVHGSAVYTLSRTGAGSEANRWLAERENAADFSGGVSLDDKDDLLASVLLDLSQTATMRASRDIAANVLSELKLLGKTHKKVVEQAGFVVLKSPDIPSILVETAFISNPREEKRLADPNHQRKLAAAIFSGIKKYFHTKAPPGTYLASLNHVISKGDTLSEIAVKYQVSVAQLRNVNSLTSDTLRIGQILKIPVGS